MAKPYSQDLRERLVLAVLGGQSRREAARSFEVSPSCVIKLMQQWETTGDCLPRKFGGHKRHALAEYEEGAGFGRGAARSDDHGAVEKADGARYQSRAVRRRTFFAASEIDL